MIKNPMVYEAQWFIASKSKTPELINKTRMFNKLVSEY